MYYISSCLFPPAPHSVKLWASAFGGEIKSIAAKYSGSQLLQKVRISPVVVVVSNGFSTENGGRFSFLNKRESSTSFGQRAFFALYTVPRPCCLLALHWLETSWLSGDFQWISVPNKITYLWSAQWSLEHSILSRYSRMMFQHGKIAASLWKNVNFIQGAELVHILSFASCFVSMQSTVLGKDDCTIVYHLCCFCNPIISQSSLPSAGMYYIITDKGNECGYLLAQLGNNLVK